MKIAPRLETLYKGTRRYSPLLVAAMALSACSGSADKIDFQPTSLMSSSSPEAVSTAPTSVTTATEIATTTTEVSTSTTTSTILIETPTTSTTTIESRPALTHKSEYMPGWGCAITKISTSAGNFAVTAKHCFETGGNTSASQVFVRNKPINFPYSNVSLREDSDWAVFSDGRRIDPSKFTFSDQEVENLAQGSILRGSFYPEVNSARAQTRGEARVIGVGRDVDQNNRPTNYLYVAIPGNLCDRGVSSGVTLYTGNDNRIVGVVSGISNSIADPNTKDFVENFELKDGEKVCVVSFGFENGTTRQISDKPLVTPTTEALPEASLEKSFRDNVLTNPKKTKNYINGTLKIPVGSSAGFSEDFYIKNPVYQIKDGQIIIGLYNKNSENKNYLITFTFPLDEITNFPIYRPNEDEKLPSSFEGIVQPNPNNNSFTAKIGGNIIFISQPTTLEQNLSPKKITVVKDSTTLSVS